MRRDQDRIGRKRAAQEEEREDGTQEAREGKERRKEDREEISPAPEEEMEEQVIRDPGQGPPD